MTYTLPTQNNQSIRWTNLWNTASNRDGLNFPSGATNIQFSYNPDNSNQLTITYTNANGRARTFTITNFDFGGTDQKTFMNNPIYINGVAQSTMANAVLNVTLTAGWLSGDDFNGSSITAFNALILQVPTEQTL